MQRVPPAAARVLSQEERMRILSWFFIVGGVLCTLTVIGMFWGLPMIGVGCLLRLAAGRRDA